MEKELTLKNDIVFKSFFGKAGNEKYLKSFLEALLEIKIEKVEVIQEASLKQLSKEYKVGRLDLKATINDETIVNIEMQIRNQHDIEQRTTYYASRLVSEQLSKKEKYEKMKPVILINILDYNFLELPEYHTETVTVAKYHREYEIIKDIKYHFIELPKFRKNRPELRNKLECWLAFIDYKDRGLVQMAKEKEKIIKEAEGDLEEILSSGALKEILEYNESAVREREIIKDNAIKEGIKKEKERTAIKLIKKNFDTVLIQELTNLSIEEIEKLRQKI